MTELSTGCTLSASIVACAKNGRNVSLTPSRASNADLARSLSLAMLVTSTSTTVVSCAEVCSDSIIRLAMTCRGRDIRCVVPRSADGTISGRGAAGAVGAGAGACAAGAAAGGWGGGGGGGGGRRGGGARGGGGGGGRGGGGRARRCLLLGGPLRAGG